jgi:hypothetical protein
MSSLLIMNYFSYLLLYRGCYREAVPFLLTGNDSSHKIKKALVF